MKKGCVYLIVLCISIIACSKTEPPKPIGPLPAEQQLAWQELGYYAFIHFNMNTFTNMEWGTGGESPEQFNPSALDARQWANVAKEAGMKGIIITAKHHDGFCLWPTKTTEHSTKNSPWKDGKGDLIKDLSEACREYGLKFGIYLSPWDRNNANYGNAEYVTIFHEQLRELLSNYGPIFEVWFDGANGGSGYYGGANETRKIDNKTYYEWDKTTEIVRELQPNAVIFSDAGPDIRWVGTEEGFANETNWSIMRRDEIYPGWPRYKELRSGHEDGTHWLPAEVNTSIRPGWYYHPREDHQVKTLSKLIQIFYESVGRNGNFLLNLPVDGRGLVHENDIAQLMALREQLDQDFANELAKGLEVSATNIRGNDNAYSAGNVNDGNPDTYWSTDDGVVSASITLSFDVPTEVNRILLQEYIPLGQRVKQFSVSAAVEGQWQKIDEQTTIGYKRILRFETVKASKIKVDIIDAKGPVTLSNIALYRAPKLVTLPKITRDKEGMVNLAVADKSVEVFYTLDGSEPSPDALKFEHPFFVNAPTTIKAVAYDGDTQHRSEIASQYFDVAKKKWKVVSVSSGDIAEAGKLIDDDPDTFWATEEGGTKPQEIVIDLGANHRLKGFTYWPIQIRYPFGIITDYTFLVSTDGKHWKTVSQGEFGNIVNNRIGQTIYFNTVEAKYIKLRANSVDGEDYRTSFGEVGIISE